MKKKHLILTILFFLSGFTALNYQIIWIKKLKLLLGTSIYSITTVVAVFMFGLSFGSFISAKLENKIIDPLKTYSIIEFFIALYAFIFPLLTDKLYIYLFNDITNIFILRFIFSLIILVFPTTLMGMTLPVLIKVFSNNNLLFGKNFSKLYAINTLGGSFGVLVTSFLLIPFLGLKLALYITVFINIIVSITAYLNSFKIKIIENKENRYFLNKELIPFIVALFFCGFSALSLEICFTDYASFLIGSSTYSFSIILSIYLVGIVIGSYILSLKILKSSKDLIKILYLLTLSFIISILMFIWTASYYPYGYLVLKRIFVENFITECYLNIFYIFLLFLIPITLLGMFFPLLTSIIKNKCNSNEFSKISGYSYFFNTLGCILGIILSGFYTIRTLGLLNSFKLSAVLISLSILLILIYEKRNISFFIIMSVLLFIPVSTWSDNVICSGVFYRISRYHSLTNFFDFYKALDSNKKIYHKTGGAGTISVIDDPEKRVLKINGKSDASDDIIDMSNNVLLSHIPMLLNTEAKKILLIGLASGVSLRSLLTYKDTTIKCIEISPEIVESCKYFKKINNEAYNNKRVKIIIDDGRNYIATSKEKYDVIISEPSNPWFGDVANLFTKEYFKECKNSVNSNGLCVFWLQLYELSDNMIYTIINTINSVFPYVSIWKTDGNNIAIVASKNKLRIDDNKINKKLAEKDILNDLKPYYITNSISFYDLNLFKKAKNILPINFNQISTDNNLIIEYNAPKDFYDFSKINRKKLFMSRFIKGNSIISDLIYKKIQFKKEQILSIAQHNSYYGYSFYSIYFFENLIKRYPGNWKYYFEFGKCLKKCKLYKRAIKNLEKGLEFNPENIEIIKYLAEIYGKIKNVKKQKDNLEKLVELKVETNLVLLSLGKIYENEKEYKKAELVYLKVYNKNKDNIPVLLSFIILYKKMNNIEKYNYYAKILYNNPKISYKLRNKLRYNN